MEESDTTIRITCVGRNITSIIYYFYLDDDAFLIYLYTYIDIVSIIYVHIPIYNKLILLQRKKIHKNVKGI